MIKVSSVSKTYVKVHRGGMSNYMWFEAIKGIIGQRHPVIHALHEVSLSVEEGSIVSILGPNGSGKTTLVRLICALLRPTTGDISVNGISVAKEPKKTKRQLSLVSGNSWVSLDMQLSVKENLEFWGALYGLRGKALDSCISNACYALRLNERMSEPLRTLSSGLRQRVALAKGLLVNAPFLIMDEPTLALDPDVASGFRSLVQDVNRRQGTTVLLTTHYMEEADQLSDVVHFLDRGELVKQGQPEVLKRELNMQTVNWRLFGDSEALPDLLSNLPCVLRYSYKIDKADMSILLSTSGSDEHSAIVAPSLADRGLAIVSSSHKGTSLEDVFVSVTGRGLHDDGGNMGLA